METYYSDIARRWVPTLLDFVFTYNDIKYNYPTLIYTQLGYNLFTLWQASRRHYRLNQTEECRTYYLAYQGTVQEKVIEIMAQKEFATACIQGSFSQEGLAAMANGVDARMKLVQAMVDNTFDEDNTESIRNMFDVINKANNSTTSEMADEHGNILFKELMGYEIAIEADNAPEEISIDLTGDIFDYFSMTQEIRSEVTPEAEIPDEESFMGFFFASFMAGCKQEEPITEKTEPALEPYKSKKRKNGMLEGQTQLLDLINL